MDKTEGKALEWMVLQYKPEIFSIMCRFVMVIISGFRDKVEENCGWSCFEKDNFLARMHERPVKRQLVSALKKAKPELIEQLIEAYGLEKDGEAHDLYHSKMGEIFDDLLEVISILINKGDYLEIAKNAKEKNDKL